MALVFLTTVKELPATLLLSPYGLLDFGYADLVSYGRSFFARAAAPALVLLAMSAFSVFLFLMQEEREVVSS